MIRIFSTFILLIGFISAPALAAGSENGILKLMMGEILKSMPSDATIDCFEDAECATGLKCIDRICQLPKLIEDTDSP